MFRLTTAALAVSVAAGLFAGCGDDSTTQVNNGGDRPPTAVAGDPQTGYVGEELTFDGTGSSDDSKIVAFMWDFGDGGTGSGITATHAYDEPGAFIVTLTVIDDGGNEDTDKTSATIGGEAPDLGIVGADTAVVGEDYEVSVSGTGGNAVESYTWNFGDSPDNVPGDAEADGAKVHVYEAHGTFTITVTVEFDSGFTDYATKEVLVLAPPFAIVGATWDGQDQDLNAQVGQVVHFNGLESTDVDGHIVRYEWDFGDNFYGIGTEVDHTFAVAGGYDVLLTVTDNDDLQGTGSYKLTIEGGGDAPVANCGPASRDVQVGSPAPFSGSGSTDADGTIVSYTWRFSDDATTPVTGENVEHTFAAEGEYTAELVVVDDSGLQGTAVCDIDVVDMPFTLPGEYNTNTPVNYSCGFGFVGVNVSHFQFSVAGNTLTVNPTPWPHLLTQTPAPAGMDFDATHEILGTGGAHLNCNEYYRLVGTFTDANNWEGTFTANFVEESPGSGACLDCGNVSFPVTGTRQ